MVDDATISAGSPPVKPQLPGYLIEILDARHGPEERRIQFHSTLGFDNCKFGDGWVEIQLEPLKQNRMIDSTLGTAPAENPVTQHQLDPLGLPSYPAIKLVELLEDSHGQASRPLVPGPLVSA